MARFLTICLLGILPCFSAYAENGFDIDALYDVSGKTVVISWKNTEKNAQSFVLQKSDDQLHWINIDTLYNTEDFNENVIIWEDRNPVPGGFLYRIKSSVDENNYSFSKPVFVVINRSMYEWNFETNGKKDKIKMEYAGTAVINGVINVLMQTRSGKILLRSRFSSLTKNITIPVTNLGKGTYYLSFFVDGELIWKQRFNK